MQHGRQQARQLKPGRAMAEKFDNYVDRQRLCPHCHQAPLLSPVRRNPRQELRLWACGASSFVSSANSNNLNLKFPDLGMQSTV